MTDSLPHAAVPAHSHDGKMAPFTPGAAATADLEGPARRALAEISRDLGDASSADVSANKALRLQTICGRLTDPKRLSDSVADGGAAA